jgi:CRP/FNR family cyclic AMP-dependent transcriptional regulator
VYGRLKLLLEEAAPAEGGRALDAAPSHLEMARRLGCSREMVSRVLKDLERGGYVEVGRRRLVLLKPLPAKW